MMPTARTDQPVFTARQRSVVDHYRNALPPQSRDAFDAAMVARLGGDASDLAVEVAARAAFTSVQEPPTACCCS